MKTLRFFTLICSLVILLAINCNAWVIPLEKYDLNMRQMELNEEENDGNALAAEDTDEGDLEGIIGIRIVKFTRKDPFMKMFNFDMDLARRYAYKTWKKLLSTYVPIMDEEIEVHTVLLYEGERLPNGMQKVQNETEEKASEQ